MAKSTSTVDTVKWSDAGPSIVNFGAHAASTRAADLSSLAASSVLKAKDLADLAKHYGRCYWELSKARLSMLVVATSGTGYILAAANSLNQVFEVNNDAKMKRTRHRPLPSGRLMLPHAITWALSVGVAGTALLACKANMLAAGLAASNLFLYAFVYTPLKQIHPVNT
ncbi:protoheme IX farnesyltransferase, mitochondrial [Olea europaea subsp. europaea]|uniref:Heme O synthase n=1 Tax=Olea europaea subsp. europaea TaxID=158383 RepID=A0A8S0S1C1_OLEEU|nr:protoheme IX farnesyltransferase, mitochondrial [Olea europaea subsp. europaea]